MRKILTTLTIMAALAAAPAVASAGEQGVAIARRFNCSNADVACPASGSGTNILEDAPLNGAAATLTAVFTLGDSNNPAQYTQVKITAQYTYSAATLATAVYSCSIDGTNYSVVSSRAVNAGTGTLSAYTETLAAAASASPLIVVDVAGCAKLKVVFDGTGAPGAGDLLTVQAVAVAGS